MSISEQLGNPRDVTLDQGTIRYRERGSGQPIVFVHGLLVNGDLWRKVVPGLARDFRCITPDWPLGSHELPMKPDADLSPPALAKLIAERLAARLPDARIEQIEDSYTFVPEDQPERLSELIAAFARKPAPAVA
jgi:pimeloyl-ACP methyl ester carboxylesterase